MQNTTNYGFNKPDASDFAKIQFLNENMDLIDELIKALQSKKANGTDLISLRNTVTTHLEQSPTYEATLINGFGGSIKYQKLAHGIVRLNVFIETITSPAALTVLTTLPTGFRPTATVPIPCYLGNLSPYEAKIPMVVKADGVINLIVGNGLSASTTAGVRGEVFYYAGV